MFSSRTTPKCTLDRDILNENTVGQMDDLGLSIFAKLCGANRGAFVMDPPDGKTYGFVFILVFRILFSSSQMTTRIMLLLNIVGSSL
jgi:hypothetical protein